MCIRFIICFWVPGIQGSGSCEKGYWRRLRIWMALLNEQGQAGSFMNSHSHFTSSNGMAGCCNCGSMLPINNLSKKSVTMSKWNGWHHNYLRDCLYSFENVTRNDQNYMQWNHLICLWFHLKLDHVYVYTSIVVQTMENALNNIRKTYIPAMILGVRYCLIVVTLIALASAFASIANCTTDVGLVEPIVLKELNSDPHQSRILIIY